jgi:hypothetical protein
MYLHVPLSMLIGVTLVPMDKSSTGDQGNYRLIALSTLDYKIMEHVMLSHVNP